MGEFAIHMVPCAAMAELAIHDVFHAPASELASPGAANAGLDTDGIVEPPNSEGI